MPQSALEEFRALVQLPDRDIRLDRSALLIAKSIHPSLDPDPSLQLLDLMAEHASCRLKGITDDRQVVLELNRYLFEVEGFQGDTESYYDPRNSLLNEVIERRIGNPVSLSIIYIEVGRRLGYKLEGVGLPGHFIVKLPRARGDIFIDPFNRGAILSEVDCKEKLEELYRGKIRFERRFLERLSHRQSVGRILSNLKAIYLHAQDPMSSLKIVELALCLTPDSPEEIKARGLLYLQLECFGQAATDLERYLLLRPEATDKSVIQQHLALANERTTKLN